MGNPLYWCLVGITTAATAWNGSSLAAKSHAAETDATKSSAKSPC
jgi:hypothetical protein